MSACLFDASNGVKGVCDVLRVNNFHRQRGSQTLNFVRVMVSFGYGKDWQKD
jgi:hypothetical protein